MATLTEFLAENPAAKAEQDVLIATARTEGETAGKEQMNEAFKAALPILSSASYPDTVKERVTAKAQAGDVEGLKDFVAIHDMNTEKKKETKAEGEQGEETNGEAPTKITKGEEGLITGEDVASAAKAMREG